MYDCITEDCKDPWDFKPTLIPGMLPVYWKNGLEFMNLDKASSRDWVWRWDYANEKIIKIARLVKESGVPWVWNWESTPVNPYLPRSPLNDKKILLILRLARKYAGSKPFIHNGLNPGEALYCDESEAAGIQGSVYLVDKGQVVFLPTVGGVMSGGVDKLIQRQLEGPDHAMVVASNCVWYGMYQSEPQWFDLWLQFYVKMIKFFKVVHPNKPIFFWMWTLFNNTREPLTKQQLIRTIQTFRDYDVRILWWGPWSDYRDGRVTEAAANA